VSEDVSGRIRRAIEDHGPIGFDGFMQHALYGPGGFFERPPIGAEGHFVTGPHVHPFAFSHCVRAALLEAWSGLGEPDPFRIVEVGAGDGTLARALLEAFGELPTPSPKYTAVEISPGARVRLAELGILVAERLDELEPFEGAVIANELLDNLPFLLARGGPEGAVEIRIGLDGDRLVEVEVPWRRELPAGIELSVPVDRRTAVPIGAFAFLDDLARSLRRGSAVLIDYGSVDGPTGGARGYREHRETADILSSPGTSDVTAGVDFAMVGAYAQVLGFEVLGTVSQARALGALGFTRWSSTMLERQTMLQRSGRGAEAVRVWEARSRASLLTDLASYGHLRWLVLATPGVPRPAWLDRALEDRPMAD
jgi:SAM-dependent MidA family methyltransferase